jgi:5-hydroxyisourate hydrolase
MAELSIHAVDVTRAVPAAGMQVTLRQLGGPVEPIVSVELTASGALPEPLVGLPAGGYEVSFHIADYYRTAGIALPETPFLDVVPFVCHLPHTNEHYHLPLKFTPWGYSLFRGA